MFYIYLFGLRDWVANLRLDGVDTAVAVLSCGGVALRHPRCEMVESSGGICALKLVHVYICTSIRGVVLRKRTTPAPDFEYHYIGTWNSNYGFSTKHMYYM
jgi:hypothetical protein